LIAWQAVGEYIKMGNKILEKRQNGLFLSKLNEYDITKFFFKIDSRIIINHISYRETYSVEKQVRLLISQLLCPTYNNPQVSKNNTTNAITKFYYLYISI